MNRIIRKNVVQIALGVTALFMLAGCSISYPLQAVRGQLQLVNAREPVGSLLERDDLGPELRDRLELSKRVLAFAHSELLLPDNDSYRTYADSGQPYVVWNVVAAPELSLQPKRWCFPVVGCVSYRGYFSKGGAQAFADGLAADGNDVFVGGVRAYSTLGKFRDPLLNTMLPMSDVEFAGLIFHELSHQLLYVKDHSAFNEAFATAVEQEGVRHWALANNLPLPDRAEYEARRVQVIALLKNARGKLKRLYAGKLSVADKRLRKQAILRQLPVSYAQLEREWAAALPVGAVYRRPYAGFINSGMNNASLAAVATYNNYVPAFNRLLVAVCAGDLNCFYAAAHSVAEMPKTKRVQRLEQLLSDAQRMQGR